MTFNVYEYVISVQYTYCRTTQIDFPRPITRNESNRHQWGQVQNPTQNSETLYPNTSGQYSFGKKRVIPQLLLEYRFHLSCGQGYTIYTFRCPKYTPIASLHVPTLLHFRPGLPGGHFAPCQSAAVSVTCHSPVRVHS